MSRARWGEEQRGRSHSSNPGLNQAAGLADAMWISAGFWGADGRVCAGEGARQVAADGFGRDCGTGSR
jgi:hypothetical protein